MHGNSTTSQDVVLDIGSDSAAGVKRHVSVWIDCMAVHFNLKALTRAAQAQLTPVAPSRPTPTPISTHTPALSLLTSMAPAVDAGLVLLEEPRSASKAAGMVAKLQLQSTSLSAVMSRGVVYVMHNGLLLPRQLHLTGELAFPPCYDAGFSVLSALTEDLSGQMRQGNASQTKWQSYETVPLVLVLLACKHC